ncbi:hypothetical protein Q5O24_12495 [Eubacteriaceae bacterium ES3]|nr:hypothetical protein Q5O24_12495 [Eubacteriaceae bacterium ES3]
MKSKIQYLAILSAVMLLIGFEPVIIQASENPSVSYCAHVENFGWQDYSSQGELSGTTGMGFRLEGIRIALNNGGYDLGLEYQAHIQNIGWEVDAGKSWRESDEFSGTEGLSYRLEAIQIKLIGSDADQFDIYYRVHSQNIGWMGWAKNGESSGTAGYGYRLEGIYIIIVPAGSSAPGSTDNYYIDKDDSNDDSSDDSNDDSSDDSNDDSSDDSNDDSSDDSNDDSSDDSDDDSSNDSNDDFMDISSIR